MNFFTTTLSYIAALCFSAAKLNVVIRFNWQYLMEKAQNITENCKQYYLENREKLLQHSKDKEMRIKLNLLFLN